MQEIAERYRPKFWFHAAEEYLPVAFDDLMLQSRLLSTVDSTYIMSKNPLESNLEYLQKVCDYSIGNNACKFDVPLNLYKGSYHAPIYACVRETPNMYTIVYVVSFAYNPATVCFGSFGAHAVDNERVTVRVDKNTMQIIDMYFGAHQENDGVWRQKGEFLEHGGRPVVFVAKASHAMYPTPGTYVYAFGFANDHCGYGSIWEPHCVLIDKDGLYPMWMRYRGDSAIVWHDYLRNTESVLQTTPLRRLVRIKCDLKWLCTRYQGVDAIEL